MKARLLYFIVLLFCITFSSNAQEMVFVKGGRISFEGKTIQKPGELLPIISQKNSPELMTAFNKYKSNRGAAQVFSFIGGFGIGYSLGGAIVGKKINGGLLAGGAGALLIGVVFSGSSNKALKQVVDLYNGSSTVSFRPFIKNEYELTQIGVTIGF